jgi:hypothetical protein
LSAFLWAASWITPFLWGQDATNDESLEDLVKFVRFGMAKGYREEKPLNGQSRFNDQGHTIRIRENQVILFKGLDCVSNVSGKRLVLF